MEEYSPGLLKRIKRKTYGFCLCFCCGVTCLLSCTGLSPFATCTRNKETPPPPTQHTGFFTKLKLKPLMSRIVMPCVLIALDMGLSDTSVLLALFRYMHTLIPYTDTTMHNTTMHNTTMHNTTVHNTTSSNHSLVFDGLDIDSSGMGEILLGMSGFLVGLYTVSALSLLGTPFLSSLRTSYQTALSMENTEDEIAGTVIPMGKTSL
jgi:hypothetical protein